jgi:hypothetical protein
MKRLFTFLLVLPVLVSIGQTNSKPILAGRIVSDSASLKNIPHRFQSILKSKNAIEIRFTATPSLNGDQGYMALIYNSKWKAEKVYIDKTKDAATSKEIITKLSIENIFNQLVDNNIFCLSDQDKVKMEKSSFDPATNVFNLENVGISDGIHYDIEFKIGDKFRHYSFFEPGSFLKFYPYVDELANYVNIIKAFNALEKE